MKKTFDIESLIGNIDGTNEELYLVGDMSTNLLPGVAHGNSSKLVNVCEIFVLGQLIMELRRITAHSQYLIDLCITNNISSSPFTPQEQRPSTVSLHSLRSCASLSSWYKLLPMDLISASNERLQVFCG